MADDCLRRLDEVRRFAEEGLRYYAAAITPALGFDHPRNADLLKEMTPLAHVLAVLSLEPGASRRAILEQRDEVIRRYVDLAD